MSIYRPKMEALRIKQEPDGWYIEDQFGPLDGPYDSARGLAGVMHRMAYPEEEWIGHHVEHERGN